MWRISTAFIIGIALGIAGVKLMTSPSESKISVQDGLIEETAVQAEGLEKAELTDLEPRIDAKPIASGAIEAILQTPSDFEQTQQLYVLAANQDADGLVDLINQAALITDQRDRLSALVILFPGLVEQDPLRAIEMTLNSPFSGMNSIKSLVWRTWADQDFEGALASAKALASSRERVLASRAFFSEADLRDKTKLALIENQLGYSLDERTAYSVILELADTSIDEAIAVVNSLPGENYKYQLGGSIGSRAAAQFGQSASSYKALLTSQTARVGFENGLIEVLAGQDPWYAVNKVLNGDIELSAIQRYGIGSYGVAFKDLARQDFVAAETAWLQIQNSNIKNQIGSQLLLALASKDLSSAFIWLGDQQGRAQILGNVLQQLYNQDADALGDALLDPSLGGGQQMNLSSYLYLRASDSPQEALQFIDRIENASLKDEAQRNVLSAWSRSDPGAVFDYVAESGASIGYGVASTLIPNLDESKIKRLLASMSRQEANTVVFRLAEHFVQKENFDLINDLDAFKDEVYFEDLQQSVFYTAASSFPERTLRYAQQLEPGVQRDRLLGSLVSTMAQSDLNLAQELLDQITNEQIKSSSTQSILYSLIQSDQKTAQEWVLNMQGGLAKDSSLASFLLFSQQTQPDDFKLLDEISDANIKQSTLSQMLFTVAKSNPKEAVKLAKRHELSPDNAARLNSIIENCLDRADGQNIRLEECSDYLSRF